MFDRLEALVVGARACVAGLEPSLLTGGDAAFAFQRFAELELLATAGRILLAKRVDETAAWAVSGARNAAEWMANTTGSTVGDAQGTLDTSRNLDAQPEVDAAVRAGELSKEKANAVSQAAKKSPGAEKDLVDTAKKSPLGVTRDACNKAKARAEDPDARAARCHKARRAGFGGEVDGMIPLTTWSPAATAAKVRAVLEKRTDQIWRAKNRGKTEWEPRDRYMHDAVVELLLGGVSSVAGDEAKKAKPAARTNVQIRIDLTALRRRRVEQGEICDAPGVGELTPGEVEMLLAEDDCIIDAVLMRGKDLLKTVRIDRYVSADVARALQLRDPICVISTCNRAYRLDRDHTENYAHTHRTSARELKRMCDPHHDLKTSGWIFTEHADGTCTLEPPPTGASP